MERHRYYVENLFATLEYLLIGFHMMLGAALGYLDLASLSISDS